MAWTKVVTESATGKVAQEAATVASIGSLTGEVTSINRVTTIAADKVDEDNLKVTNAPTDNYLLSSDTASGGFTWVAPPTGNIATNLGITGTTGARVITSSDGTDAEIPVATTLVSGVMSTGIFDAVALNTAKDTNVVQTTVSGNAGTATKLATARAINGTNFDGSAAITVTANAGTLTGLGLKSTVISSSLTSVGALTSGSLGAGFTAVPIAQGGTGSTTAGDARTALGVRIGQHVQAWDAQLDTLAGASGASAANATAVNNLTGTNSGDETQSSINALAITTVGTIGNGSWNASAIPVGKGGTGVTSKTGTGNNVLSASPTLTGTVNAASLTLSGDLIVNGSTTTINTATLSVEDENIIMGIPASGSAYSTDVIAATAVNKGGISLYTDALGVEADFAKVNWDKAGSLTGWQAKDTHANEFPIAVMSFSTADATGDGAGVGSFHYDTNGDNLWLRTS